MKIEEYIRYIYPLEEKIKELEEKIKELEEIINEKL